MVRVCLCKGATQAYNTEYKDHLARLERGRESTRKLRQCKAWNFAGEQQIKITQLR
jgi:hypothetical protein